jgi:hypothetical protein
VQARAALAVGDPDAGLGAARLALRLASSAGPRLVHIDAVETIATIAHHANEHATAARLLGATTAERHHRGFRGRLTTTATPSLVDQLASSDTATWSGATTEPLDQRTRQLLAEPPFT